MTRMCGAFRPSFVTKIYLTNVWSIELCTFLFEPITSTLFDNDMAARHPTHSLLRFLLVSNSLDLILDILLEMWSAVVGKIVTFSSMYLTVPPLRIRTPICSPGNSICSRFRYSGSKKSGLLLDSCYFRCQSFLCSSRYFSKLAYPKVL